MNIEKTKRSEHYNGRNYANYNGGIITLPDAFDLQADFDCPKSWLARRDNGSYVRVWIDHDGTGTGTTGTGDTVCKSHKP